MVVFISGLPIGQETHHWGRNFEQELVATLEWRMAAGSNPWLGLFLPETAAAVAGGRW